MSSTATRQSTGGTRHPLDLPRQTEDCPGTPAPKSKRLQQQQRGRIRHLELSEDEESEPDSSEDERSTSSTNRTSFSASETPSQRRSGPSKRQRTQAVPPTPESTPSRRNFRMLDTATASKDILNTPTKTKSKPPSSHTVAVQRPSTPEPLVQHKPALPAQLQTTPQQLQKDDDDVTSATRVYSATNLRLLQACVLSKLRGHQALLVKDHKSGYLPSMEFYEKDVRNSLERTISEEEGNCTLLVGPRGVGKSTMVQNTLNALREKHGSDGFLLVKLNGLVHNTDRLALRDIARQLCAPQLQELAASFEDEGASFTSHASTLASLLAILEPSTPTSSSSSAHNKAIIFLLDEFDLFALRDARQSFLYCLLDIVQSHRRGGGMAVLGLSSRIDCLNMLEKRLKSRCQNRVLHVLGHQNRWLDVARAGLRIDTEALQEVVPSAHQDLDDSVQSLVHEWNVKGIETLLSLDSTKEAMDKVLAVSSRKADVFDVLVQSVSSIKVTTEATVVSLLDIRPRVLLAPSRIKRTLASLSLSELTVLVSLKHALTEQETFNMTMAQQSYRNHLKRQPHSQKGLSHSSFAKAFEHLKAMGILADFQGSSITVRGNAALWRMTRLVPWMKHIDEVVANSSHCPEPLKRFCKSPDA